MDRIIFQREEIGHDSICGGDNEKMDTYLWNIWIDLIIGLFLLLLFRAAEAIEVIEWSSVRDLRRPDWINSRWRSLCRLQWVWIPGVSAVLWVWKERGVSAVSPVQDQIQASQRFVLVVNNTTQDKWKVTIGSIIIVDWMIIWSSVFKEARKRGNWNLPLDEYVFHRFLISTFCEEKKVPH